MKRYNHPYLVDSDSPPGLMACHIRRLAGGQDRLVDAAVAIEEPLEICLNGQAVAVLMRTPGLEKELAAGFCLGEGLISDLKDIALVRHCGRAVPASASEGDALDESRNQVDVTLLPGVARAARPQRPVQLIRSGCGRTEVTSLLDDLEPVDSDLRIEASTIPPLLGQITRRQTAYRAAGGIHAAAIFDAYGRVMVVCEDIGRHNAVDKATGYCLLRGISLHDKILISTGRASYDMVAKGVRLGLPILASISSPTSLAVELAEALNCTLLGYLRGKTMNVYCHGWRIVAQAAPGDDPGFPRTGE